MAEPPSGRVFSSEQPGSDETLPPAEGPRAKDPDLASPSPGYRGALASRDFSLLLVGQIGSEVGNGLVQLALPFVVLELTGSAFQAFFAYAVQFIPVLIFGIVGGVLVDRWDRRMTIVVVDALRAVAFISVGMLYALNKDAVTVEYFYGLILLEASLQNFFNPARLALMTNLVPEDNLRAANSLMEIPRNVGFLIAPSVGVVLAGLLGSGTIIAVDGFTFLISGFTVLMIRYRPPRRLATAAQTWRENFEQVKRQTAEGIGVIKRVRLLQVAMLLGVSLNLAVAPIQGLLPLYVVEVKHASAEKEYLGLLAASFVLGSIIGSLTAPMTSRRIGLGPLAIASVILLGAMITISSWLPTFWSPMIALVIAGIAVGSLNVAQINMLQTSTTDEERGRVSAAYYTSTLGVRPLGYLVVGVLTAPVGIQEVFVILGVIVLVVGAYIVRIPDVRNFH